MLEVSIITFRLGYASMVRDAEERAAALLNHGWVAIGSGGSDAAGFLAFAREAPEVATPPAPSPGPEEPYRRVTRPRVIPRAEKGAGP